MVLWQTDWNLIPNKHIIFPSLWAVNWRLQMNPISPIHEQTFYSPLIKWVQILHSSLLSLIFFLKFKHVYILSVLTCHSNTSGSCRFVWFSCVWVCGYVCVCVLRMPVIATHLQHMFYKITGVALFKKPKFNIMFIAGEFNRSHREALNSSALLCVLPPACCYSPYTFQMLI